MANIRVAILFGGQSVEHEVSLQSAKNVFDAINKDKYDVSLIGIDKDGKWHLNNSSKYLLNENDPKLIKLNNSNQNLAIIPGNTNSKIMNITNNSGIDNIDVVFSVIHGTTGEDGVLQGFLKLADIPFVGPSVLGSAICMDKDVAKRLMRDSEIPTSKFLTFHKNQINNIDFNQVKEKLGLPVFIKPANSGSSVGVNKARNQEEFIRGIKDSFKYDNKILVEEFIKGREIECSVMGNEEPIVSIAGEIMAQHEFYSYDAKYIDDNGAVTKIPADLSPDTLKKLQYYAIKAFKTLCCEGMARVDFFVTENDEIYLNELNTIPGFTKISMYPKLWEASGVPYSELIDKLITYALERHKRDKELSITVE
ncbi:MAG: D-alanine--D-alanine ligase [Candidatus Sericytochromatia bacterium]